MLPVHALITKRLRHTLSSYYPKEDKSIALGVPPAPLLRYGRYLHSNRFLDHCVLYLLLPDSWS